MRTTGSTMSRFDKHRAVKSSGMPHSRRDNAVRGNPAAHQNINTRQMAGIYILSCGIWIRPYNRQIVWFGTSALARSERGPPQFIAVGITIQQPTKTQTDRMVGFCFMLGQKSFTFLCVFGTIVGESSGDTGSGLSHARQIRCNMASRRKSDVLSVKCVVIYS